MALIAAGAKNGIGPVGIAYNATIMAIRADEPGSCASATDCSFGDVGDAIQWAVDHGATVINMSLGGASATGAEIAAVQAAAAAGIVVVISSGNEGSNRPDPFPRTLAALGLGNVIIVGSVNSNGSISNFSNRAKDSEQYFVAALGSLINVDLDPNDSQIDIASGTSFSAPQVAGAVALLKQSFPAMTGQEIVSLLFETAQDVGTPGIDATYGWGVLDIYEAFQPQGTTTLAGKTTAALPLTDTVAVGSAAMGDALKTVSLSATVLDKYRRAYQQDFGFNMRGASIQRRLFGALDNRARSVSINRGPAAMAFSIDRSNLVAGNDPANQLRLSPEDAERARVLAARVALRISPKAQLGFTYAEGADGLVLQLQGQERPAFLIAQAPGGDEGSFRRTDVALAFRRQFGGWGLTVSAESGAALSGNELDLAGEGFYGRKEDAVRSIGMALDRRFGAFDATLGASLMNEQRTVLGARFHDAFGGGGADTLFLDATAGWSIAGKWRLGGSWRQGWTYAGNGALIGNGSMLSTRAWSVDLERRGIFAADDRLALRFSQPLRVESGGLKLDLPVSYSYDTLSATYATELLNLTPEGRELLGELAWRGRLWGGWGSASVFYRRDPGHYAEVPDDAGVALRWSTDF